MALISKFNTKDIRLLQVLPHLGSGGLVSGAIEIASYLKSKGGVSLVLSSGGYREKDLNRTNCYLEFLPVDSKNPFIIIKNINKIVDIAKKYRINIISFNTDRILYGGMVVISIGKKIDWKTSRNYRHCHSS